MGQPKGVTVEEVQERNRLKSRVQDTATCIFADAITRSLHLYSKNVATLQRDYHLTADEAQSVLNVLRALRKCIDPYGDWEA